MLNAFRHHWNLHEKSHHCSLQTKGVLNAFRHHWNLHLLDIEFNLAARLCSTPFGIIGIFTTLQASSGHSITGAQRLSASLESSPAARQPAIVAALGAQRLSASLESSLRMRFTSRHSSAVLNAFRHHWNLHSPRSFPSEPCDRRAQRLSASLESSQPCPPSQIRQYASRHMCAQRLSASLESSLTRSM